MEDQVPEVVPTLSNPAADPDLAEVAIKPPETMKVSWSADDRDPVQTGRAIRAIKIYSNVDQRQLRVMKTADAENCLHIYVDVP